MKKIFTLIAVTFATLSVNAQTAEVWDASSLKNEAAPWNAVNAEKIVKTENTASNVVIHDPNDVLPWPGKHQKLDENGDPVVDDNGDPVYEPNVTDPTTVSNNGSDKLYNYTVTASTASVVMTAICTPNLGETDSWQFGLGTDPTAEEVTNNRALNKDGCDPAFIDYIKAKSGNCTEMYYDWYEYNEDGDPVHKVSNDAWDPSCGVKPAIGSWYEFAVSQAGTMKIAFFINKNIQNNKLYFAELQADKLHYTLLDPTQLTVWGWTNNNSYADDNENTHKNTKPREDYCIVQATNIQNPFLGYVTFTAEKDKTYMFLSPQTQLGCYGFSFTPDGSTGITNVQTADNTVDAPAYNLAGQRVAADYKGVVVKNGRKYVQK